MPRFFFQPLFLLTLWAGLAGCTPDVLNEPEVLDKGLKLTLVAEAPDIVTPIGIAADSQDRLYVLESHTHSPPDQYGGPQGDLVKRFVDEDQDGTWDRIEIVAEGFQDGMNLRFGPDKQLYLVTSRSVVRLVESEGSLMMNPETILAFEEPASVYDHAGLLGVAFSHDGWLYVSRGNTGGAYWKLVGTDGNFAEGYGDGGNIVRCRLDGSNLEEYATGFWNPFDMAFDNAGRLLAIDNDPDSRGPNKLVHVVKGGDYGYRSLYGGSGIHPYLSWNGEREGTLPYALGLGEAPSGILSARLAALPATYENSMLVSIWEERNIVQVDLAPNGLSVQGSSNVILQGKDDFRPVAFTTDSVGRIYFTDWVKRDYPVHGEGKIWRLEAVSGATIQPPASRFDAPSQDHDQRQLLSIQEAGPERLVPMLEDTDPFVRHAARQQLRQNMSRDALRALLERSEAAVRLGALTALGPLELSDADLQGALTDPDPKVQRQALILTGLAARGTLLTEVTGLLDQGRIPASNFDAYLATVRHLQPAFVEGFHTRSEARSSALERPLPSGYLEELVGRSELDSHLRVQALNRMPAQERSISYLQALLADPEEDIRRTVASMLVTLPGSEADSLLLDTVNSPGESDAVRAEAILALSLRAGDYPEAIIPWLTKGDALVRMAAARYFVNHQADERWMGRLRDIWSTAQADEHNQSLAEMLAMGLFEPGDEAYPERPESDAAWLDAVFMGGRPELGRQVFFYSEAQCSSCHTFGASGGAYGPELTHVGKSKTREQMLTAILNPAQEVAPEWQAWFIQTADGATHIGRQIDVGLDRVELQLLDGKFYTFEDVKAFGVSNTSLMPIGLETYLTPSDMRNLMAFLEEGSD